MVRIPVSNRRKEVVAHALVDDEWAHLAAVSWCLHQKGYVYRQVRRKGNWRKRTTIYLHRQVTECPPHLEVDHKDVNPLNCQLSNLELVPKTVNVRRGNERRRTIIKLVPSSSYGDVPV